MSTAPVLAAPAKVLAAPAPVLAPAPAVLAPAYAPAYAAPLHSAPLLAPAPVLAAAPLVNSYAAPAPLAFAATKTYGGYAPLGLAAPYGLASDPYAYSSPLLAAPAVYKSSYGLGYRK